MYSYFIFHIFNDQILSLQKITVNITPLCYSNTTHNMRCIGAPDLCVQYTVSGKNIIIILIFCFGRCCFPSFLLSSFSIVCILVDVLQFSNGFVDSPCCNIEPCGSPCILKMSVHWAVVCCTTNSKREKEMLVLWV